MIKNEKTRLVSGLLGLGFLADRAILSLAGIDPANPKVEDKEPLTEVVSFLEAIRDGFAGKAPVVTRPLSAGWSRSVTFLDWSFIASKEKKESEAAFLEWIAGLLDTVHHLSDEQPIGESELESLRFFLNEVGSVSLTQAQSLQKRTDGGEGLSKWPLLANS